jgi:DNA-binding MarR family transcriptional regulator
MQSTTKKSVGFLITTTANLLNNSINSELKPYKIAIEQRAILEIIESKKEIKQSDLTNLLGKDKTTISRTLKTLENKNFIIKERIDNRTYKLKLSKLGEKAVMETKVIVDNFREKILLEFTENELDNLYLSLEKINLIVKNEKTISYSK